MYEKFKDFQLVIFGLILGLSFLIGSNTITKHLSKGGIYVTGSSFAIVKSDSASWMIQFASRGKTNAEAYNALKTQLPTVLSFLKTNGITDDQIDIAPASSYPTFKTDPKTGYSTGDIAYYNYDQAIKVTDDDVQLIKRLSNSIQELNAKGIELRSSSPEYQYSKMSELKVKLLQEATKDSKERAKAMLKANKNGGFPNNYT